MNLLHLDLPAPRRSRPLLDRARARVVAFIHAQTRAGATRLRDADTIRRAVELIPEPHWRDEVARIFQERVPSQRVSGDRRG